MPKCCHILDVNILRLDSRDISPCCDGTNTMLYFVIIIIVVTIYCRPLCWLCDVKCSALQFWTKTSESLQPKLNYDWVWLFFPLRYR